MDTCVCYSEKRVGKVYSKTKSFVEYVRRALSRLELDDSKVEPFGFLRKSEGNGKCCRETVKKNNNNKSVKVLLPGNSVRS